MYKKINFVKTDPNKKNILITASQLETKEYTYGYIVPLIDVLKENYNVYVLLESSSKTPDKFGLENVYLFDKKFFDELKDTKMRRKKEDENSEYFNNELIKTEISKFFENEPVFHDIIVIDNHNLMLPYGVYTKHSVLATYWNDYFDIFERTDEIQEEIDRLNEKYFRVVTKAFSPLTFRYYYKGVLLNTIHVLYEKHNCKVDIIIIDPSAAIPFFELHGIKHKMWYYSDDFRGKRKFNRFPFPELQHLVYEKNYKPIIQKNILDGNKKIINHFFSGSLLNSKGTRKYIWPTFFRDYRYPDTEFYFKLNTIFGMSEVEYKKIQNEVYEHPSFKGDFMDNVVYVNKLKQSKTAFVARSVSVEEALTYRHIQYLDLDVLPIFDNEYDSGCTWIPQKFQDKLTVSNTKELMEKVDYYCTHEEERLKLLAEMKEYYQIDEYPEHWKEIIKESNFYKELCN